MEEKIKQIAELVTGLKYYEWNQIEHAIDKKFAQVSSRIELNDTEAIINAIKMDIIH